MKLQWREGEKIDGQPYIWLVLVDPPWCKSGGTYCTGIQASAINGVWHVKDLEDDLKFSTEAEMDKFLLDYMNQKVKERMERE